MSDIVQKINIGASPEKVYEAVASGDGVRNWWCTRSDVATTVGAEHSMKFNHEGQEMGMAFRTDALDFAGRVAWTCVANDNPMWIGSTIEWAISPSGDGSTLTLTHAGIAGDGEAPESIAMGWQYFNGSLKSYCETGTGQPSG